MAFWRRRRKETSAGPAPTIQNSGWTAELYETFIQTSYSLDVMITEFSVSSTIMIHRGEHFRVKHANAAEGHIRSARNIKSFVTFSDYLHERESPPVATGCYSSHYGWDAQTREVNLPAFDFTVRVTPAFIEDLEVAWVRGLARVGGMPIRFMVRGRGVLRHPAGIDWPKDYFNHQIDFHEALIWTA